MDPQHWLEVWWTAIRWPVPGALHIDIDQVLQDHQARQAIENLGDAILTGHTGTNINDLKLILVSK